MARFDTSVYNPATAAISRAYGDIGDTFDMLNRMRWKEEQMEQARLDQQRAEAREMSMSPAFLTAKAREVGYENLNPLEKATLDIAASKAQRQAFDPVTGQMVVTGAFPDYRGEQAPVGGFESVQAIATPQGEAVAVEEGVATDDELLSRAETPKERAEIRSMLTREQFEERKAQREAKAEMKKMQPKMERSLRSAVQSFEGLSGAIDRAIEQTDVASAGFFGNMTDWIGGTPAANLKANLQTIQADAAFDTLQQMRDNSPTGGALGAISEKELALLQNARVALNQSQSPEQLKANLQRYKEIREQALQNVADAYKQDFGQLPEWFTMKSEEEVVEEPAAGGKPERGQVIDGYRFKGGNPANEANWEKV